MQLTLCVRPIDNLMVSFANQTCGGKCSNCKYHAVDSELAHRLDLEWHTSVKSTKPSQRCVNCVWPIGGPHYNDVSTRLQSVHQSQKLRYNSLLNFTLCLFTLWSDGINLIDENDGRGILFSLFKSLQENEMPCFTISSKQMHKKPKSTTDISKNWCKLGETADLEKKKNIQHKK